MSVGAKSRPVLTALLAVTLLLPASRLRAQQVAQASPPHRVAVRAAWLIDGRGGAPVAGVVVLVESDRMAMLSDISALASENDPWLRLLQFLTLVVFVGAAAVALWHAGVVWTGKRR